MTIRSRVNKLHEAMTKADDQSVVRINTILLLEATNERMAGRYTDRDGARLVIVCDAGQRPNDLPTGVKVFAGYDPFDDV